MSETLLSGYDALLSDLDGVVYAGPFAIPGAPETARPAVSARFRQSPGDPAGRVARPGAGPGQPERHLRATQGQTSRALAPKAHYPAAWRRD